MFQNQPDGSLSVGGRSATLERTALSAVDPLVIDHKASVANFISFHAFRLVSLFQYSQAGHTMVTSPRSSTYEVPVIVKSLAVGYRHTTRESIKWKMRSGAL